MSKATEGKVSDDHIPSDVSIPVHSQSTTPQASSSSNAGPSRIVGSQAKRQEEVTRQGAQKMKFVPTLPVRRKKPDTEMKQKEVMSTPSQSTERGRGRGREFGLELGRGRGRGRGGPPPPRPEMQMTASGPFAMGPSLAGSSKRRTPRSNFTPVMPMGSGLSSLGDGLSRAGAPVLGQVRERRERGTVKEEEEDVEVYSDPDEGVQIVDMDAVKTMDWMAPESLRREPNDGKRMKKRKAEVSAKEKGMEKGMGKGGSKAETVEAVIEKNLANALNLSESEEEEEMEDLIEDFAMENLDMEDEDSLTRQEKLYFFQFPQPFPAFSAPDEGVVINVDGMVVDGHKPVVDSAKGNTADKGKKVSFVEDVKLPGPTGSHDTHEKQCAAQEGGGSNSAAEERLDGVIGQLEVHRSGMIKMRLINGMLMDVTAATQPSFLQHAVLLNPVTKKLHVLGEVNRRFVVSPDVDKLLEEMDKAEAAEQIKVDSTMDIT